MYLLEVCSSAGSPSYRRASEAVHVLGLDQGNQRVVECVIEKHFAPFLSAHLAGVVAGQMPPVRSGICHLSAAKGMGNIKLPKCGRHSFGMKQADRRRSGDSGRSGPVPPASVRPPSTRPPCVGARTSGHPQRKIQGKHWEEKARPYRLIRMGEALARTEEGSLGVTWQSDVPDVGSGWRRTRYAV